jgi:hypothetical protein
LENPHHRRHDLFEYNPSIILQPDDLRIDINTGGGEREGGGGGETTAYSLALYRVTTTHLCVHGKENLIMLGNVEGKRSKQQDYLGRRSASGQQECGRFSPLCLFRTASADRRVVIRFYLPFLVERQQQRQQQQQHYTIVVLGAAEPPDGGRDTATRDVALKGVHGPRRTGLRALLWQQPRQ